LKLRLFQLSNLCLRIVRVVALLSWGLLRYLSLFQERRRQRGRAQRVAHRVQEQRARTGVARKRLGPEDVAAVLVTRGDVDLAPILATLPYGEVVVWDNSIREQAYAYGRYRAIAETKAPVIYFQDDDCLVVAHDLLLAEYEPGLLVANMPSKRSDYIDTVLLGWGSLFDRDLPFLAFEKWAAAGHDATSEEFQRIAADFVFPMLTPWKRVDFGHQDLAWSEADNRTFRQRGYDKAKRRVLKQARELSDSAEVPQLDERTRADG
jgi:hypothetical protein